MKITTGDIVVESLRAADIVVTSVEVSPKVTIDMSLPDGTYHLDDIGDFQTCPQKD